jgi:ribosomal protein S18 acetylase RimI-like enzyme
VPVADYCERTASGLWGEPYNAVSNLAFLVAAAVLLWLVGRRRPAAPVRVWLLPALLGVVGLCSLSFHTMATRFTEALDTLSILAFVLVALAVLLHDMWGVRWRWAWLSAPAFIAFAVAVDAPLTDVFGAGAALGGYLPALLGLVGVAVALRRRRGLARYGKWLLWAAGVFAVSLTARTLDRPLCTDIPTGTHFVWHILNAVVLFTVGYAVVDRYRRGSGPRVRPAEPGDHDWIVRTLTAGWGSTTAVAHGVAYDAGTLPALIAQDGGERAGLLTYVIAGGDLEVVTLDAAKRHSGAGTALLAAAADVARAAGAGRLWLVTTNDNLDALRFYQRRGMRIAGVTPGGVDASRLLKPSIPTIGAYGIPLRDELTLELLL